MNPNYHKLKCPVNATGDLARPLWAGVPGSRFGFPG